MTDAYNADSSSSPASIDPKSIFCDGALRTHVELAEGTQRFPAVVFHYVTKPSRQTSCVKFVPGYATQHFRCEGKGRSVTDAF